MRGTDGKRLWDVSLVGFAASLAVAGGQVYVSEQPDNSPNGYFQVLNPDTGAVLWMKQRDNGTTFSPPAAANGVVYVSARPFGPPGTVDAYDAASGAQRWEFPEPAGMYLSQPVLGDGAVYVLDTQSVYALDAGSGAQHWSAPLDSRGNEYLVAMNGMLYFLTGATGNGQQTIVALDAGSGAQRWVWNPAAVAQAAFSPLSGVLPVLFTAGNGIVYAWYNGKVTALRGSDGAQQWQASINQSGSDVKGMMMG